MTENKSKLGVKDVTWADIEKIAKLDLMEDDIMELLGTGQYNIPQILVNSCMGSLNRVCRCVYELDTGDIVAVFGLTDGDMIWFLSDKRLMNNYKEFIKRTKYEFERLIKDVDYAYNFVHWYHKRAIRWLTWLGFIRQAGFYEFPPETQRYIRFEFMKEEL